MKRCPRCRCVLGLEAFGKDRNRKDGLQCWCKGCAVAAETDRRRRNRAAGRQPRPPTSEQRERSRQRSKEWRAAHPERQAELRRRWEAANTERHAANRAKERQSVAWKEAMRRAKRRRRVGQDDEAVAYAAIIERDPCSYCGDAGGTIDHIVPVARGGVNAWSNLTGACLRCNGRKQTLSLLRFLLRDRMRYGRSLADTGA